MRLWLHDMSDRLFWLISVTAILVSSFLLGCAHTVPSGLEAAQAGLAAVDLGTDAFADAYTKAVQLCEEHPLPACDRLGDPDEVAGKLEALGAAYDATADGLDAMEEAWIEVAPHFEAAREVLMDSFRQ